MEREGGGQRLIGVVKMVGLVKVGRVGWQYLGNKKSYQRSASVKPTGFSRAFQLSAWVTPSDNKLHSQF